MVFIRASSSEEENLRKEERISELQARMEKVKEEAELILEQVTYEAGLWFLRGGEACQF